MTARSWAVVALTGAALTARTGVAAAQEPTPTPAPTPSATPIPVPTPPPVGPAVGSTVIYVVTTTTTTVNAPITWVAAPITTNVTNSTETSGTTTNSSTGVPGAPAASSPAASGRLELDLTGCGRPGTSKLSARGKRVVEQAHLRVPLDATLVIRVNGRRVGTLQLAGAAPSDRGIPLRIQLGADGRLTVNRPSGRILRVRACNR
jgi:hypothetical protein